MLATDGLSPCKLDYVGVNGANKLDIPNQAPENGYLPMSTLSSLRKGIDKNYSGNDIITNDCDKQIAFRFRVRRSTFEHESGRINVYYGKIRDIQFGAGRSNLYLQFTYYLNPTPNDRNLEFDRYRNLLKGLDHTEEVTAP